MQTARMLEAEWRQILPGSVGMGDKGRLGKYWAHLGYWISLCYDPFSLGARFDTYKLFISFIFNFFFLGGYP
jgi:hypothetical protein